MAKECDERIIDAVLTAATRVHTELGPGLLESVYEQALALELEAAGLEAKTQVAVPVSYRGRDLGLGFRADLVVEEQLLVELKCVERVNSVHLAQVLTYLKLLGLKRGFIINFNTQLLKHGIRRISL